jgi:radical SAM superfamily enzyme YgiQ (UPF0313 family)
MKSILFIELFRNGFSHGTMPKSLEPNISTLSAFSELKKRYVLDFIDLKVDDVDRDRFRKALRKRRYADVFIEIRSYNRYFALDIIQEVKTRIKGVKVYCFGQHPSVDPGFILDHFDDVMVIKDEIIPFMKGFTHGKDPRTLPNTIYRKGTRTIRNKVEEITDLDSLPDVDIQTLKEKRYFTIYPMKSVAPQSWGFLALTKGCPHSCVFCSQTLRITHGKRLYHFSLEEAMRRIERQVNAGFTFIRFFDDNLLSTPRFIEQVCKEIIKRKIRFKWMAQVRADSVTDSLLGLMKKSGCESLNIGVETGSDTIMKTLKKGETVADIRRCFRLCRKHKLLTVAYFMIGNPGETAKDLRKSYRLLKEIKPDMLQVAFFTPYPGTPYYQKMKSKDQLRTGFYHYDHIVSNFSEVSDDTLIKVRRKWYVSFYLKPKNFFRLASYRLHSLVYNPAREVKIIINSLRYLVGL